VGQMEFGQNKDNVREYLPTYGGIDWHDAWLARHPEEIGRLSVWGEAFDELGEFCEQLNQTNCAFYLNDTDDDFDCLVVIDDRDDSGDFWWTRGQLGEDFDMLLDTLGEEVMIIHTKYPAQQAAEFVLRIMMNDIIE